jgi:hypothetical protein
MFDTFEDYQQTPNAFQLVSPEYTCILVTTSEEARDEWMQILTDTIQRLVTNTLLLKERSAFTFTPDPKRNHIWTAKRKSQLSEASTRSEVATSSVTAASSNSSPRASLQPTPSAHAQSSVPAAASNSSPRSSVQPTPSNESVQTQTSVPATEEDSDIELVYDELMGWHLVSKKEQHTQS